jgi:hypothetical protein
LHHAHKDLPEDVNCFVARGEIESELFHGFAKKLGAKKIQWEEFDEGDGNAGSIRTVER